MSGVGSAPGDHDETVVLDAFRAAAMRETQNLSRWPELLWQQLANRLQWEEGAVSQVVSDARRRVPRRWIRSRTQPYESKALLFTLEGHERTPRYLAFSPDGTFVVSGGDGGALLVWDVVAGTERFRLTSPGWPSLEIGFGCALTPDGSRVIAYAADEAIKVWDPATGAELRSLEGHEGWVRRCALSADGHVLVSAADDGEVRVWDVWSGSCVGVLRGHDGSIRACATSRDSKTIISAGWDATVRAWEWPGGRLVWSVEGECRLDDCGVSPDGRFVLTGDDSGQPLTTHQWSVFDAHSGKRRFSVEGRGIWTFLPRGGEVLLQHPEGRLVVHDLNSGNVVRSFGEPGEVVTTCAVSPDGALLLTAGSDGAVRIWDAATAGLRAELAGHAGRVWDAVFSPDGARIVSCADELALKVWDTARAGTETQRPGHGVEAGGGSISKVQFSPDGAIVASGGWDGTVKLWGAESGHELRTLEGHVRNPGYLAIISACEFVPSGTALLSTARNSSSPIVWDGLEGDPSPVALAGEIESVDACALGADGTLLVALDSVDSLQGWDLGTRRSWPRVETRLFAEGGLAVSADGRFVAGIEKNQQDDRGVVMRAGGAGSWVAPRRDRVVLYDVVGGVELTALAPETGIEDFAVSPDSTLIATAGEDGLIRLWDADAGRETGALRGHEGRVTSCTIAPDGRLLTSIGADATVRFWDLGSGSELGRVDEGAATCRFTPDGRLAVFRAERTVGVWEVPSGERIVAIPMRGRSTLLALHPWQPVVACGEEDGTVSIHELIGIDYGPIVVTAVGPPEQPLVRCPKCGAAHALDEAWLGEEVACPTPACGLDLRVNPFVVQLRIAAPPDESRAFVAPPREHTGYWTPMPSRTSPSRTRGGDLLSQLQAWAADGDEGEDEPKRRWFGRRRRR